MTKIVTSTTSAVSVSPIARGVRTLVQAITAFGAAEPILIAGLGLTAAQASRVSGITAGLVFVASTVQNALEHFGLWPTFGGKVTGETTSLEVVPGTPTP